MLINLKTKITFKECNQTKWCL